ncbi:MAG: NADH-ubiquinone oxidoreductase chain C [uncultured Nocardioidaceae bacterium]|uniref:NADH-ubiquinone oxidoreductase chain C n=1 Tax=uncultured Nocardioidaceae bacterium TaxID=253824 RepID=A0A6J4MUY3_9ACTN|nr:MAG: NADH-ubiquinone oxidoreductase chain C [uncultured Nocardioidaceae bacterium]
MTWAEQVSAAYATEPLADTTPLTVDVEAAGWLQAVRTARAALGCEFFDFLTAVDEQPHGFTVVAHLVSLRVGGVDAVLLRTRLPATDPSIACVCGEFAGAAWHERETHEMFGIGIDGHERLDALLLPDDFAGHPLRKDFVLASRVAKPWPGAKEPGESDRAASPSRRRTRPPGVPDPGDWGPSATPGGGDSPARQG